MRLTIPPAPRDHPEATKFLKSTPGILTAVATFLAAVTGLIAALTQLRGNGDHAAAATTTVIEAQSAADRELLSDIPASIRPSCGKAVDPEEGNAAAFNCSYRDVVHLQYNLYASATELRRAFADVQKRYGATGNVLRFVDHGSASIVWTDEKRALLAFAWRNDRDQQALDDAWSVIDRAG